MNKILSMLSGLLLLLAGLPAAAEEIRVSAAASLTEVVKALGENYRKDHPGVRFVHNFGSSGTLAKQIGAGAPADLFISANPEWMTHLAERNLIAAGTVQTLASNELVVVGPPDKGIANLGDLASLDRIALGSPASAPVGRYAEQALTKAGLYRDLSAKGRLVMAKDVRQALMYAERGEVDAAFVYRTDARLAKRAKVLLVVPQDLYPKISYPLGVTIEGAKRAEVTAFADYLASIEARRILQEFGFITE